MTPDLNCLTIRVDGGTEPGLGHVMRCLAFAHSWRCLGGDIVFVMDAEGMIGQSIVGKSGFLVLSTPSSSSLAGDASFTVDIASKYRSTWVLLDGYHFDSTYQETIHEILRLAVIDDLNHLESYHADIIMNQNIHAPSLKYACGRDTKLLLGPKYALLRPEFNKYANQKKHISERCKNILITMGGADPDNISLKILEAISTLVIPGLYIKMIAGSANLNLKSLHEYVEQDSLSVEILESADDMSVLMAWADIAITAAGSTLLELSFMGVPSIVISIDERQTVTGTAIHAKGSSIYLGNQNDISAARLAEMIEKLYCDRSGREALRLSCQKMVDGRGTQRLLDRMTA